MHVVMTGATGFIGRRLVDALLAAGHRVTALTRDLAQAQRRLPVRCACKRWDPPGTLDAQLVRGADAIVHLAGEGVADGRWTPARKLAIRESRVAGSAAIVRAIAALAPAERPRTLVSASAIGYYGDRGDETVDEQSSAGNDFLADVSRAWEGEVFKAESLGVRVAAIRVGVVLGRDGGALAKILPPCRLGVGGRIGSGSQWMSWIHVDDIVALFGFVLGNPDARGPINGVAPAAVTNAEFTRELGRALGRPTLFPVPAVALRVALGEMSAVLLGGQRVEPQAAARLGFQWRYAQLSPALAQLCGDASHELRAEQWVPRPLEEVFRFYSDPYNLEKITPPFVRFRVLSTTDAQLRSGTLINYRLALHGLPIRWQSRIETWEAPRRFVDSQTRGPYALWHHTHEFEPFESGTIVRDRVRYALPGGALADVIAGPLVRRDVEAIFAFRRAKTEELFG